MVANVLDSPRAVVMSVEVVRAFIRLRKAAMVSGRIAKKLVELERAVKIRLDEHDEKIEELFETVAALIGEESPPSSKQRIGFIQ